MGEHLSLNTKRIVKFVLTIIAVLLGTFLFFKLSIYLAPFIIAYLLSLIAEPFIRFLTRRIKLKRKPAALITVLLMIIVLGLAVTLIVLKLISEIKSMSRVLPGFFSNLYNNLIVLAEKGKDIYEWLPVEVTSNIGSIISNISSTLIRIANSIVSGAFSTAVSLPEAFIFILMTLLSTYFISSDRERIYGYIRSQLPDSWIQRMVSVKNDMFSALFGYLKAQLTIMVITFTELFIGLSIIRVKYSLLFALIISIIDILPILGTGGILVPWAIYSFLTGNIRMGISVLILYIIITIVRQLIEPRIVGHHIGVYPLMTLIAMYLGLKLFGVFGLFLGPITFLMLKNIFTGLYKNRSFKELIGKPKISK